MAANLPGSDPTTAFWLVPATWMAVAAWVFVEMIGVGGGGGGRRMDFNGDGAVTITDLLRLGWAVWATATVMPVGLLLGAVRELAPSTYRFFEVDGALNWLGGGIVIVGVLAWVGILVIVVLVETGIRGAVAARSERR